MRKMSRRWKSLRLVLRQFLFEFITENVCSHKYMKPNKQHIFCKSLNIWKLAFIQLPVKVHKGTLLVSHWSSMSSSCSIEHHRGPRRREKKISNISFSIAPKSWKPCLNLEARNAMSGAYVFVCAHILSRGRLFITSCSARKCAVFGFSWHSLW